MGGLRRWKFRGGDEWEVVGESCYFGGCWSSFVLFGAFD